MTARLLSSGDTALVVEFGNRVDRALSDRVLALDAAVRAAEIPGITETVPSFRSLMVHYDPLATSAAALSSALAGLLDRAGTVAGAARVWRIPVCYDPACASDLAEVASRTGLSREEVVALHSGSLYHVYMLGFLPGYPYLGDLPPALMLPRREEPRLRVLPGSIGIATSLTAIYPLESPGGWHLIGATPVRLFDARRQPPALLAPGDAVRFEPVGLAEYEDIRAAVAAGAYAVACAPRPP